MADPEKSNESDADSKAAAADKAKPKGKTRTLNVKQAFGIINPANGEIAKYPVGVHEDVPAEHADHWMAKACATEVK